MRCNHDSPKMKGKNKSLEHVFLDYIKAVLIIIQVNVLSKELPRFCQEILKRITHCLKLT